MNLHRSVFKTGYFIDSLTTPKSLKLGYSILNKFNHPYY